MNKKPMSTIHLQSKLYKIGDWVIVRLPEKESEKLPSRGQVMVEGTINDVAFKTPLEPDGKWSHWFKVDEKLQKDARAKVGDTVALSLTPTKNWPEPKVPTDWQNALEADEKAFKLWAKITPMARWEWIRWIRATNRDETRKRRIEVGLSKLKSGERRPCCWNRNMCTEPSVSQNGVLLDLF
jgi:hypothetical protein